MAVVASKAQYTRSEFHSLKVMVLAVQDYFIELSHVNKDMGVLLPVEFDCVKSFF